MKKYDSILKRVEEVECKLGVSYAKTNGKLYKICRFFNLLGVIYLFCINLLFILGALLMKSNGNPIATDQTVILIAVFTALEVLGQVFTFTKLNIIGNALNLAALSYLIFISVKLCEGYTSGFFGLTLIFYIRHLPSFIIILLFSTWMLVISLRQRIKTNRQYKRIISNLYVNYNNAHKSDNLEVSDEEWEEFISNYDPKTIKTD